VSTVIFRKILNSDDEDKKRRIRDVAAGGDGVLAPDTSTDQFEVISDDELQNALAQVDVESTSSRSAEVAYEPANKDARRRRAVAGNDTGSAPNSRG
jgi:hypothetical protein